MLLTKYLKSNRLTELQVIRNQCKNLENLADKLQTTLDAAAAANPNTANVLHLLWTDHIKGVCLENVESMKPSS